jgi:glutaredoxin 3
MVLYATLSRLKVVSQTQVVVFSWSVCPFAQRAQRVLREAGAKFVAIELDQVPDGKAIKAELGFLTGMPLLLDPCPFY